MCIRDRFHKDIITGHGSVVVVDGGLGAQRGLCAIAHHQAAAALGQVVLGFIVFLRGLIACDGDGGSIVNGQLATLPAEDATCIIVGDGHSTVFDVQCGRRTSQPQTCIVAVSMGIRQTLCTGDRHRGIGDAAFAGEGDTGEAIVAGSNGGILNVQVSGCLLYTSRCV